MKRWKMIAATSVIALFGAISLSILWERQRIDLQPGRAARASNAIDRGRMESAPSRALSPNRLFVDDRQAVEALVALADAGDPKATCTLSWVVDRCTHALEIEEHRSALLEMSLLLDRRYPGKAEAFVSEADAQASVLAEIAAICGNVDEKLRSQGARRMYRSAKLGHVRAMVRFALDPPVGEDGTIDDTLAAAHRAEAMTMLVKAADAGDLEALRGLYLADFGGYLPSDYGTIRLHRNLARAYAAGAILRQHARADYHPDLDRELSMIGVEMSESDRREAGSYLERYRRIFSNAIPVDFTGYRLPGTYSEECETSSGHRM